MRQERNLQHYLIAGFLAALLLTTGCESKIYTHGNQLEPEKLARVQPGSTRLIELEALFGKPSAYGAFGSGQVYYIHQNMEEAPGRRKTTINRTIVTFTLDQNNVVQALDIIDQESGRTVYHLDAKTPTPGDNFGILQQIFSNVRRGNLGTN